MFSILMKEKTFGEDFRNHISSISDEQLAERFYVGYEYKYTGKRSLGTIKKRW